MENARKHRFYYDSHNKVNWGTQYVRWLDSKYFGPHGNTTIRLTNARPMRPEESHFDTLVSDDTLRCELASVLDISAAPKLPINTPYPFGEELFTLHKSGDISGPIRNLEFATEMMSAVFPPSLNRSA